MRINKGSVIRAASILLLAATVLCAVALPRDAGARIINLPNAARSLNRQPPSPQQSTAAGRIAFDQEGEIYLINADGTGLTQLTHNEPGLYYYQPALSPDGTRVAFGRIQNNRSGISVIDVDGSGLRKLTTNNTTWDNEPAWSPDGSKIAFVRGYDPTAEGIANFTHCPAAEIYVVSVDSDDSEIFNLTPDLNSTDPAWSPDGRRIAFASNRGGNYDIYAETIDGGEVKQLTFTDEQEAEPAWSPDGRQIAFARDYMRAQLDCGFVHTGGPTDPPLLNGPDIYLMSTDGSDQNRLTVTGNNIEPTWSPDGTSLAFVSFRDGNAQIYVMDTNHGTESSITSDRRHKSSPSWSSADPRLSIDEKLVGTRGTDRALLKTAKAGNLRPRLRRGAGLPNAAARFAGWFLQP